MATATISWISGKEPMVVSWEVLKDKRVYIKGAERKLLPTRNGGVRAVVRLTARAVSASTVSKCYGCPPSVDKILLWEHPEKGGWYDLTGKEVVAPEMSAAFLCGKVHIKEFQTGSMPIQFQYEVLKLDDVEGEVPTEVTGLIQV